MDLTGIAPSYRPEKFKSGGNEKEFAKTKKKQKTKNNTKIPVDKEREKRKKDFLNRSKN